MLLNKYLSFLRRALRRAPMKTPYASIRRFLSFYNRTHVASPALIPVSLRVDGCAYISAYYCYYL